MHLRRARRRPRGQILIAFTISFGVLLLGLTALIVNLSVMYAASGRASEAALIAAQRGAGTTDLAVYASTGKLVLDQTMVSGKKRYVATCESAGDAIAGANTTACICPTADQPGCAKPNEAVIATVDVSVRLPIPLPGFGGTMTVSATQQSAAIQGGATPAP